MSDWKAKRLVLHESISGKHNKPKGQCNQSEVKSLVEGKVPSHNKATNCTAVTQRKTEKTASLVMIFPTRT